MKRTEGYSYVGNFEDTESMVRFSFFLKKSLKVLNDNQKP